LVLAFALGNYAQVRRESPGLEEQARNLHDEVLLANVRELRARIAPDPLGKLLFVVALLLSLGLGLAAYAGGLGP
jgi:hypothetical protein